MRAWTGVLVVAVLAGGGVLGWRALHPAAAPDPPAPAVPVSVAVATMADVPDYLIGIGTVRALNAAEIHPQVGGVLIQVPVLEGQEVEAGTVLAVIDPRPFQAALDKAKAQLVQDQAQLDNARLDQTRYSELARRDFASRQQLDTQTASVNRFQGVVDADRAAITEAEINLGYCVVRAPWAGRIGLRRVDAGNLVQANQTGPGIFSLVQDRPITVVFTLPENALPPVKAAMAHGEVPVLADTSDRTRELARGTLLTPDNVVDPATGTFSLKAKFPNEDGALTPGQFVSTRLQARIVSGVTVPRTAIQHGQDKLFVLTVKDGNTAERQDVEVAYEDATRSVLSKGLAAGTKVVTAGQSRVGKGTKLAFKEDGAAPAPSGATAPPASGGTAR